MNEYKVKFLDYISKNYNDVIVEAQGGPYIEVDLIPDGHDGLHEVVEIVESCNRRGIDVAIFTRHGYTSKVGDGIRMGRYFYYMQETTKEILQDLKKRVLNELNNL